MGRHSKTLLIDAGFENVTSGYSADHFDSPQEIGFLRRFLSQWGLSREFMQRTGSNSREFGRWQDQVERWSRHPGAVGCFHFGWAMGRKPRKGETE